MGKEGFEGNCDDWVCSGNEVSTIVNLERMLNGSWWYAIIFKKSRSAARKLRLICTSLLWVSMADSLLYFWTISNNFC